MHRFPGMMAFVLSISEVLAQSVPVTPQNHWEEKFRSMPHPDSMRSYMQRLSARPHHLGSAYDKDNAEWILGRFNSWGLDAHIETFDVLFPTPRERVLELVAPGKFVAKLQEPAFPEDPTSQQVDEQLPTYNAYSIDGDVTAGLVYVNYGIPDDYQKLERLGVSVKGKIVIARYGASWRGIKPKVAAEHGAVGCLIYSDPHGDGYTQGDVFPIGPYRPRDGVQRGSVMDMPLYPGDPLTPGVGAGTNAKRLPIKDAPTLTKIPVLPISYADAQPLLASLGRPVAPEPWRGSLPITYHVGSGETIVHLKVAFHWDRKTIYDVVATIPGATYADEWIIRGNHHDAWVNGAQDPLSGQVALLEEARTFGRLLKEGWKPKRTIVYCAWDAEEEGLIGSTEWVETHEEVLKHKAVAYINSDANGRGFLSMLGSHTLEKFINGVARDIEDPEKKISVWKRAQLERIADGETGPEQRSELRQRADLRIDALGSGSDYTAFLDHLGVPSLNLGYGGEDGGGIYHSIYDDFYWFTHFSDSAFVYGRALAQTAGTAVMRLADAGVLPFDFTALADAVKLYLADLQKLLKTRQDEITERNKQIGEGALAATADPRQTFVPPSVEDVPPHLNFAPLQNALDRLSRSADDFETAKRKVNSVRNVGSVNRILIQSERALTHPDGLPGRPWFRHQIYAPGLYTGYGVKTLPGVREAIELKQWKLADEQIAKVARTLAQESSLIDSATKELEKDLRDR